MHGGKGKKKLEKDFFKILLEIYSPLKPLNTERKLCLVSFTVGTQCNSVKFTLLGRGILNSCSSMYTMCSYRYTLQCVHTPTKTSYSKQLSFVLLNI